MWKKRKQIDYYRAIETDRERESEREREREREGGERYLKRNEICVAGRKSK